MSEPRHVELKKALLLFESGYLDYLEVGTFQSLATIHGYLFDEIYEFAGKVRDANVAKGILFIRQRIYGDNKVFL